jgi:hypothetical protein
LLTLNVFCFFVFFAFREFARSSGCSLTLLDFDSHTGLPRAQQFHTDAQNASIGGTAETEVDRWEESMTWQGVCIWLGSIGWDGGALEEILEEIRRCHDRSAGMYYIGLIGDRYGSSVLPTRIPAATMKAVIDRLQAANQHAFVDLIHEWFRLDTNPAPSGAVDCVWVLRGPWDVIPYIQVRCSDPISTQNLTLIIFFFFFKLSSSSILIG